MRRNPFRVKHRLSSQFDLDEKMNLINTKTLPSRKNESDNIYTSEKSNSSRTNNIINNKIINQKKTKPKKEITFKKYEQDIEKGNKIRREIYIDNLNEYISNIQKGFGSFDNLGSLLRKEYKYKKEKRTITENEYEYDEELELNPITPKLCNYSYLFSSNNYFYGDSHIKGNILVSPKSVCVLPKREPLYYSSGLYILSTKLY